MGLGDIDSEECRYREKRRRHMEKINIRTWGLGDIENGEWRYIKKIV